MVNLTTDLTDWEKHAYIKLTDPVFYLYKSGQWLISKLLAAHNLTIIEAHFYMDKKIRHDNLTHLIKSNEMVNLNYEIVSHHFAIIIQKYKNGSYYVLL